MSVNSQEQKPAKRKLKNSASSTLSPRSTAALIVQECVESGQSLATLLPRYLDSLNPKQRPLAQEISYGVLRWYYRLNALALNMLSKPLKGKKKRVHYLILTGLYQIIYLDKADYAVVKETVNGCYELKEGWAKGLVNAILRRFLREKEALLSSLDQSLSTQYAYPKWLVKAIQHCWSDSGTDIESILDAGNQRPPMTLRVNGQNSPENYKKQLAEKGINFLESALTADYPFCITLEKPQAVENLPMFLDGGVSVQDGAAQLAATLLNPQANELLLDACAAPGGKTMHLLELQPEMKQLIAMDVSSERLERVKQSSERLKIAQGKLQFLAADATQNDWWDGQLFDRILLDAPCSATGVIRRHPDIKVLRRSDDIAALTTLQSQILDNLWAMLKPGGTLLYATCSILRDENDRQLKAFLERHDDALEERIDAQWGRPMPVGRQILPGEDNMDGFYYALLNKKTADGDDTMEDKCPSGEKQG